MYTIISEAQPLCDCRYVADVLKDERDDIYLAVEVTIDCVPKVFLVFIDNVVDFFKNGVDYGVMNNASEHTFETYDAFCKWCSYNLTS